MKAIIFCTGLFLLITGCGGKLDEHSALHNANSANGSDRRGAVSDHNSMDHGPTGHNSTGHSHSGMKSSPGAATATMDLQFLDTMIAHHKGAVEMATLAQTQAISHELKELAAGMVGDQEREIGKMTEWRDSWFEGKADAINMEFPGMAHGMNGMDMEKLRSLTGKAFDLEFLRQMIPHHEGAVEMSNAIRASNGRPEIKELAGDIITAQQSEIKRMQEWVAAWSN